MLLYVLSHGYEGRLGVEAISRRGLGLLHRCPVPDRRHERAGIAGDRGRPLQARRNARPAWQRCCRAWPATPPTAIELDEAKSHLIGRRSTAAQSNDEVSAALIDEWVGTGSSAVGRRVRGGRERGLARRMWNGSFPRSWPERRSSSRGPSDANARVKKIGLSLGCLVGLALGDCARLRVVQPAIIADLIVSGGRILTLGEPASVEAVAIGGGRILAIGDLAEVERLSRPGTRRIRPRGPGAGAGLRRSSRPPAQSRVFRCSTGPSRRPPLSISPVSIRWRRSANGSGSSHRRSPRAPGFSARAGVRAPGAPPSCRPTRCCRAAAPDHPVFFTRVDGHAGWANNEALRAAGIDAATPDPPGGVIRRAPDRSPSGVLLERANELLRPLLPEPSPAEIRRAFRLAARSAVGARRHRGLRRRFPRTARGG